MLGQRLRRSPRNVYDVHPALMQRYTVRVTCEVSSIRLHGLAIYIDQSTLYRKLRRLNHSEEHAG